MALNLVSSSQANSLAAQDTLLYTCRGDGFINCYNLTTNELVKTLEGHKGSCWLIQLAEPNYLYSAGEDKMLKKWDLVTGQLLVSYKGINNICY
jgi:WD40 repeat protein